MGTRAMNWDSVKSRAVSPVFFSSLADVFRCKAPVSWSEGMLLNGCKPVMVIPFSFVMISVGEASDLALTNEPQGKVCWGLPGRMNFQKEPCMKGEPLP